MSWGALLGAERLLRSAGVKAPPVDALIDHLWAHSTVSMGGGPSTFHEWHADEPDLTSVETTDQLPREVTDSFLAAGISVWDGFLLLLRLTDMIYDNAFAAIDWYGTNRIFDDVVQILRKYELGVPDPQVLPSSGRDEDHGWGSPVTSDELQVIPAIRW
jgi:hypothetical protein